MKSNNKYLKDISENTGSIHENKHRNNNYYLKRIAENTGEGSTGGGWSVIKVKLDYEMLGAVRRQAGVVICDKNSATIYSYLLGVDEPTLTAYFSKLPNVELSTYKFINGNIPLILSEDEDYDLEVNLSG